MYKYKGVVPGMSFDPLSETDLIELISAKVYKFDRKAEQADYDDVPIDLLNSNFLNHRIIFRDNLYSFNEQMIDEVFTSIINGIKESHSITCYLPDFLDQITVEASARILRIDKENYLRKILDETLASFKQNHGDEEDALWHYGLSTEDPNSVGFLSFMKKAVYGSLVTIGYHLRSGDYNEIGLEFLEEQFEEEGEFNYVGYWIDWIWFWRISTLAEKLLNDEKSKPPPKVINRNLEEIFKDSNEFHEFIKKLKEEEVLTNDLKIIVGESEEKKLWSAICFLLRKSNKLKEHTAKELILAFNNQFSTDLKENTYSNHKNHFDQFYPHRKSDEKHLDRLHFIK